MPDPLDESDEDLVQARPIPVGFVTHHVAGYNLRDAGQDHWNRGFFIDMVGSASTDALALVTCPSYPPDRPRRPRPPRPRCRSANSVISIGEYCRTDKGKGIEMAAPNLESDPLKLPSNNGISNHDIFAQI